MYERNFKYRIPNNNSMKLFKVYEKVTNIFFSDKKVFKKLENEGLKVLSKGIK